MSTTIVPIWQLTDGNSGADLGTFATATVEEAHDIQARLEGYADEADRQAKAPRPIDSMKVGDTGMQALVTADALATELGTMVPAVFEGGKTVETFDPEQWLSVAASDFEGPSSSKAN